jgi:phage host-nuclease inhibitor protein Gam
MPKRSGVWWLGLAASLTLSSEAALAQQEAVARGACTADVERLCAGVAPGHGRIATCLMDKQAELSPECAQQIEQMRARARAFAQACKGDIDKYCKGMRAGSGKLAKCLKDNQAKLTPACKEAFAP